MFGLNEACYRPRHALSLFLLPLQSSRGWPRYHHRQRLCHFHHPHHRLHILWCKWDIINANNDANEDRNALMISCVRKEKCWFINASTKYIVNQKKYTHIFILCRLMPVICFTLLQKYSQDNFGYVNSTRIVI